MRQEANPVRKAFEKMEVKYVGQVNEVVQQFSACTNKRGAAPDGCTQLLAQGGPH